MPEMLRCRKLTLSRYIDLEGGGGGGCWCATSWCDLDLTFDLVIVTLSLKILSGVTYVTVNL